MHERVAELEAQLQEAEAAAELSGTAPALTLEQATEALIDQLAGLTLAELREWQQSFSVRLGTAMRERQGDEALVAQAAEAKRTKRKNAKPAARRRLNHSA